MNLPVVIEIAIGLVFIYLILSLLTSELQELVTILLQWRAEHLKKSIENLLTGEGEDDPLYQKFVDEFYESPLIRSLNQEAKGLFATAFRKIIHNSSRFYHRITGTRNIFGQQKSGPSYIPAETFSVALLQKLRIDQLSQRISEFSAKKFSEERLILLQTILDDLRNSLGDNSLLDTEFGHLQHNLEAIVNDFVSGRATFAGSIEQVSEQIVQFIDNTEKLLEGNHHCQEIIRRRLPYIRQMILHRPPEPTIAEVLRLILDPNHALKQVPEIAEMLDRLDRERPEFFKQIVDLPQHLKQNLLSLAEQAHLKAHSLEEAVRQLETEVANWFNNSMDRASGVYKRNAKGVGIVIGFLVAMFINADTLHMIGSLSQDTMLRQTITQAADRMIEQSAATPGASPLPGETQADLKEIKNSVRAVLDEIPLPIGWNPVIVKQQETSDRYWIIPFLRRSMGWLVTGIALSMGASFWYDLLQRVIRVRATGEKPGEK